MHCEGYAWFGSLQLNRESANGNYA